MLTAKVEEIMMRERNTHVHRSQKDNQQTGSSAFTGPHEPSSFRCDYTFLFKVEVEKWNEGHHVTFTMNSMEAKVWAFAEEQMCAGTARD